MSYLAKAKTLNSFSSFTSLRARSQKDPTHPPGHASQERAGPNELNELNELSPDARCRWCDQIIDWRRGLGLAFADGIVAHVACDDEREIERYLAAGRRAVESPDALADPAELMLQPGGLS